MTDFLRGLLRNNFGTKFISIAIALVLWFVVLGSRNVEVIKEIPIEILTADEIVVANDVPSRVAFKLSGPKAFLRAILDRRESPIRVNLTASETGTVTYRFFTDNIRVPIGVKVTSINPTAIVVRLEEKAHRSVPVKVVLRGKPAEGYDVISAEADPPEISIMGPRSRVDRIKVVSTTPVDVSDLNQALERPAAFELDAMGVELEGSPPRVRVEIGAASANYKIKNVSLRVKTQYKTRVNRKNVTVFVRANPKDLEGLDESAVFAEVDLRGRPKGSYQEKVSVNMPGNIGLVKVIPEEVSDTLY